MGTRQLFKNILEVNCYMYLREDGRLVNYTARNLHIPAYSTKQEFYYIFELLDNYFLFLPNYGT